MQNVLEKTFYLFLALFILPSGSILGIPVKIMLIMVLTAVLIGMSIRRKVYLDKATIALLFVLVCLLLWMGLGFVNGFTETSIQAFKSFISLISVVLFSWVMYKNRLLDLYKTIKVLKNVSIILVASKIVVEILLQTNLLSWMSFRNMYSLLFSETLTTNIFYFGAVNIYRIMLPNDGIALIPFSFYLFSDNKFSKKLVLSLVMAIYTFITYSRVIYAQYAIVLAVPIFYFVFMERKAEKKKMIETIVCLMIGVISVGALYVNISDTEIYHSFMNTLETRLSGADATYSDSIRATQFDALSESFEENVLFGKGLGAYVSDCIRNNENKSSYELEYLSFLNQFGIVGFGLIIVVLIVTFFYICVYENKHKLIILAVLMNLGIWVVKPLFNPQFLSSNSAMIIITIMFYGIYYNEKLAVSEKTKQ